MKVHLDAGPDRKRTVAESVTARDFESKPIARNLLGSLATVESRMTAETVVFFASSNFTLLLA